MQPPAPPQSQPAPPYPPSWGYGPWPRPPRAPRGVTVGIALELAGIAIVMFALLVPYNQGLTGSIGSPVVGFLGLVVVLVGLLMHVAGV